MDCQWCVSGVDQHACALRPVETVGLARRVQLGSQGQSVNQTAIDDDGMVCEVRGVRAICSGTVMGISWKGRRGRK